MIIIFRRQGMLQTNSQFKLAQDHFNNSQYKKSFLQLIAISNSYSNDLDFLRLLSQVQMSLKDFQGQIKTLSVLSSKSNVNSDKIKFMMALLSQGRRNESLDEAMKLLAQENLSIQDKVIVLKALMKIYSIENDFEGLQEVCAELQSFVSDDAEIRYSLALIDASQGLLDNAIEHLRIAVTLDPLFDQGWAALGLYHYQKGDIDLAKANLEKALDINPSNTTALKHLAHWIDESNTDKMNSAIEKVNYYLQKHNFDEDISECHAHLLIKKGQTNFAKLEIDKLTYYFGN